ncbi:2-polyprenyl-6-methoxyphenol hydroxylase-like FAD-dependent oxidoreductase [Catalinimonas alkaloidigena]|uniref:FAD-dependent monooxygenase n=1 Tax=Catalinimonas alkaloidigena TaxID=1075417 RepID=UPI002406BC6D|nr:FAD-dependent monooxygenase [Catalinimonas alkaloidigena]MDF9801204.1 2-polyprenyl-6-methoxyphenol hydroxylase-like FAD-dependent oxidoreductase [Catalinimonas alkaloidigena]
MKKIAIIGGGIGGLCAAVALQQKGFDAQVYEKAPQLKAVGAGISLSANAVLALRQIKLDEPLIQAGNILRHMRILDEKGKQIADTNLEPVEREFGAVNFSIHRAILHEILMEHLTPGSLHLGKALSSFQQHKQVMRCTFEDGAEVSADAVIAFDGIHSAVRKQLLPELDIRYAGYTCWRAIIDYVPEGWEGHQATETWGRNGRFGIVPIGHGKLYWFATANAPEQDQRMRFFGVQELRKHFESYHAPIDDILSHTRDEHLIWNDIIDLKPIPQYAFGRVALAGDAAHATTPNMGQGACMAIEDAMVIANLLERYGVEEAFQRYESQRMKRTHTIVKSSYQLGKVAQWENKLLAKLRNIAFRLIPVSVQQKQIRQVYNVKL